MSTYPGAVWDKNVQDTGNDGAPDDAIAQATDYNEASDEIAAIQTELGTGTSPNGVKGAMADLKTRLAVSLNADGSLKVTTVVAGSYTNCSITVGTDGRITAISTGGATYSDEQAQDAIGTILLDDETLDFTYDDSTPNITAKVLMSAIFQMGLDAAKPAANANRIGWLYVSTDGTNGYELKRCDGSNWTKIATIGSDDITAHVALSDPHTQYQKEVEKNVANGYAGLDSSGFIDNAQIVKGQTPGTSCAGDDPRLESSIYIFDQLTATTTSFAITPATLNGEYRYNNVSPESSATKIYVRGADDRFGRDMSFIWPLVAVGDCIALYRYTDKTQYQIWRIDAVAVSGGNYTFDVTNLRYSSSIGLGAVTIEVMFRNKHAIRHQHGGDDEIATATPAANVIPKAGAAGTLAIGFLATGTPDGTKFVRDDGTLQTVSTTNSTMKETITQTTHGFVAGDALYLNGATWAKAKADSVITGEVLGVVESAPTANTFVIIYVGLITLSGLTAGAVYFLSDVTAGLLTVTVPTVIGYVNKPVMVAKTTTIGIVINYRGMRVVNSAIGTQLWMSMMDYSSGQSAQYPLIHSQHRSWFGA